MNLKILFVINGLGTGGSERSLIEMLPCLVQCNITLVIVCLYRRSEGVERQVLCQGFSVRFLDGNRLISRVKALRAIIAAEQPDIIHTTHFESDLTGRLAALGCPAVVMSSLVNTYYSRVRLKDPNIVAIKFRAVQMIDTLTARFLTAHFHAVSHAVKTAAIKTMWLPPERITVIERGRDPVHLGKCSEERRRRARLKLDLQADDKVIVNVGRHEYQKGQKYLLKAMAELVVMYPRLVLLLAGRSGRASSELKELRDRLGLNENIRFLGHRDDIPEILAAADLFVFPSLYEGLPGAVIEAMALGLPIVATDIAPVREVVEEDCNALLVKPGSTTELAAAMEKLLKDCSQADLFAQRSREIFEARFILEQSVSRLVKLYNQVARVNHREFEEKYVEQP